MKLFSLKNFTLSLNEAPKAHYFCFLLLIKSSAVQQKSNKATLSNNKNFFYCKTCCTYKRYVLMLHNNFLVFNISYNCWKSSHNLCTLPNHNSRHLRVDVSEHAAARPLNFLPPQFENQTFWKRLRWRINHFALNLLSRVCWNTI